MRQPFAVLPPYTVHGMKNASCFGPHSNPPPVVFQACTIATPRGAFTNIVTVYSMLHKASDAVYMVSLFHHNVPRHAMNSHPATLHNNKHFLLYLWYPVLLYCTIIYQFNGTFGDRSISNKINLLRPLCSISGMHGIGCRTYQPARSF